VENYLEEAGMHDVLAGFRRLVPYFEHLQVHTVCGEILNQFDKLPVKLQHKIQNK
jgi:hypothetical protein